jgi:hypothetical protein
MQENIQWQEISIKSKRTCSRLDSNKVYIYDRGVHARKNARKSTQFAMYIGEEIGNINEKIQE